MGGGLPDLKAEVMVEYLHAQRDGKFWLDILVDRKPYYSEPFDSAAERQRAHDDLLAMMRDAGALDMPSRPQ